LFVSFSVISHFWNSQTIASISGQTDIEDHFEIAVGEHGFLRSDHCPASFSFFYGTVRRLRVYWCKQRSQSFGDRGGRSWFPYKFNKILWVATLFGNCHSSGLRSWQGSDR